MSVKLQMDRGLGAVKFPPDASPSEADRRARNMGEALTETADRCTARDGRPSDEFGVEVGCGWSKFGEIMSHVCATKYVVFAVRRTKGRS